MKLEILLSFVAISAFAGRTNKVDFVQYVDAGDVGNSVVSEVKPVSSINPVKSADFITGIVNDIVSEQATESVAINSDTSVAQSNQANLLSNDVKLNPVKNEAKVETIAPIVKSQNVDVIQNDIGVNPSEITKPVELSNFCLMELYNPAYCSTLYGLAHGTNVDYRVVQMAIRLMELKEKTMAECKHSN